METEQQTIEDSTDKMNFFYTLITTMQSKITRTKAKWDEMDAKYGCGGWEF